MSSINSSKRTKMSQLANVMLDSKSILNSGLFHLPANIHLPAQQHETLESTIL
jgi:hypothetical protein